MCCEVNFFMTIANCGKIDVEIFTQEWRNIAGTTDWQILWYYDSYNHSVDEQSAVSPFCIRL
jgi:hypothetical protein